MTENPTRSAPPSRPRLFLVDDNIRDVGGHFFELAMLLAGGAHTLGFDPVLATNQRFNDFSSVPDHIRCDGVFRPRRMVRWSLGVDGNSCTRRDFDGAPRGDRFWLRAKTRLSDSMAPPSKRPQTMIRQWSDDLLAWLKSNQPTRNDSILINTGDDFVMLALANALRRYDCQHRLTFDVIFHFALYHSTADDTPRASLFGQQVNDCIAQCAPHTIRLHATTDALAGQMRASGIRHSIGSIPYPTRPRSIKASSGKSSSGSLSSGNPSSGQVPLRIVLAGLPRAEKGREAIHDFLAAVDQPLLQTARYRVSMQMPASKSRWQPMIPKSMHDQYVSAMQTSADDSAGPFEVMTENLTTAQYHAWLDSADVGLFLYDPERYVARCSGVLLEMMVRGVPVIVPDQCYLSDEVMAAGGDGSIGYIYRRRDEVPGLMLRLLRDLPDLCERCHKHAKRVAAKHDGANTLRMIGLANGLTNDLTDELTNESANGAGDSTTRAA